MIHRGGHDIGAQHHAGTAARRRIIDAAVLVGGEIAGIDGVAGPFPLGERPARQRGAERSGEHLGIKGEDLGGEGHFFLRQLIHNIDVVMPTKKLPNRPTAAPIDIVSMPPLLQISTSVQ